MRTTLTTPLTGGASQGSDGAKSMADRELPKLPPAQEEEDQDHDYDILDDQKLAYHALTPPSVSRMVDYDTIENLQMGMAQLEYSSLPRGGFVRYGCCCAGKFGDIF